jgi:tRNA/rRNA methyltransferase
VIPDLLDTLAIVLVEPQHPGNVGMVCRAMKNMGLTHLRVVKGCRIDHPDAVKFAVSAKDLIGTAERFETLADALADTEISIATTRRRGKYRQEVLTVAEAAERLLPLLGTHRAALVFGREDSGLTTEEVSLCRWNATIPTGDEYGSLNLAQAVLVFCYEIFSRSGTFTVDEEVRNQATSGELETCFRQMEEVCLKIGFLNPQNPDHIMRSLRRIFFRAEMDSREVSIIRGMLTQIDWAAGNFEGKKKV